MGHRRLIVPGFLCAALAACAVDAPGEEAAGVRPLGADFGNASGINAALQIIDPQPAFADEGAPGLDGERAAAAMGRYRGGAVRPLEPDSTTGRKRQ